MAINPFQFNTQFEDGGFDADSGGQSELTPVVSQAKPAPSADVINKLTQQILSRGTANWSGEGLGSAQANAADMAKILAGIGITDVNQFGKFTQTGISVEVRPDGRGGFVDDKGKAVNPSLVQEQTQSGEGGEFTSYTAPVGTQEVFGNKVTKQAVPETYGERQTGNFFGGTFAGKGNTGYGVQFDAQGNPIFYTQGASSADVAGNPIVALALAVVLPGIGTAIGETLAISNAAGTAIAKVAVNVAMGQPLDAAIKDAAISSIVQTGSMDVAKEIVSAGTDPKIANAIASVGGSVVQTAARGGDASDILRNAVSAAGASSLISMDVSPTIAKAVGVAISGGTPEQVIKSLASSGGESKDVKNAVANALLPSEPPEAPAPTTTPEAPAIPPPAATTPEPTPDASVPAVEVTAPTPVSAEQPILDLIKKDAAKVAEAAPVTPTPEAPAPAPAPVEELKVTEKKEEPPVIVDTSAPPLITPTPSVAETPSPTAPPVPEVEVAAPRPTVSPEDQPILDLIAPKEPPVPEVQVTAPRDEEVKVTAKRDEVPIIDTTTPPVVPEEMVVTAPRDEEVKVTAKKEDVPIIDTVPEMTITDKKVPEMVITAPKEPAIIDTIPEIEITDKKVPEMVITAPKEPTIIDTTLPDTAEPVEEEPAPEEPYKPQLTIFGGVPTKRRTLPQSLQTPFYPSAGLTQALTAQRGAGEIEGDPSGKPRKNVWNEASLRLKDALGL